MRHKIASITQLLRLPAICDLCSQYHPGSVAICAACTSLMTPIGSACSSCACPLPRGDFLVCGHCSRKKPDLDRVITAYCFEEPLRTLLHEFKYREGLHLLTFLTSLMLEALPTEGYKSECLIPVPMHPIRLRQRGFNQAAELAKQLSRATTIPCNLFHCTKIINTLPQAGLDAKTRRRNLHKAYDVQLKNYQHVTLIDDLMTTGSTANELARTLKKQGVSRVDLWCCARVSV